MEGSPASVWDYMKACVCVCARLCLLYTKYTISPLFLAVTANVILFPNIHWAKQGYQMRQAQNSISAGQQNKQVDTLCTNVLKHNYAAYSDNRVCNACCKNRTEWLQDCWKPLDLKGKPRSQPRFLLHFIQVYKGFFKVMSSYFVCNSINLTKGSNLQWHKTARKAASWNQQLFCVFVWLMT